ncbi:amino acid permease [Paenibacillus sp. YN15]|uniref:amino acid permease n=1 Tax=Paenibacillus sp. YN15 TaxID=1742774 RepID=UPI000DCD9001|nr:amino acid permease [Paenibacillus sp. YN15]RAU98949.1 amino acid permease [Paenibacillus sp. YN15]
MEQKTKASSREQQLPWWQLSLLGVACTVGTGFFLGSAIAIGIGGPSVLFNYALAALGTYLVFDQLARMTAEQPLEGSFRSYAQKAYGRWAGFSSGWVYWSSELLIMGSQLTALSLFSRYWFPSVPMWCFAAGYGGLGLLVIVWGTKGFERLENTLAVMKLAALLMFLAIAGLALAGVISPDEHGASMPAQWLPKGITALWSALIFSFYAFGGIEVIGLMTIRLRNPKDAPKAGKAMLGALAVLYVLSIGFVLLLEPWTSYAANESPFIASLAEYHLAFVPHVFNAVLIIAGFSTMTASLFAVTSIVVTMAKDHDAPAVFARAAGKNGKKPVASIGLSAAGLTASVIFALFMPESVYEYLTTAAGIMLLYNWFFILATAWRRLPATPFTRTKQIAGMSLIALAVAGTLFHSISRPGFFISLGFTGVIGLLTLFMARRWKNRHGEPSTEQKLKRLHTEENSEANEEQARKHRYGSKERAR